MATSVAERIRKLEADAGEGWECPRCSGVIEVFCEGAFSSATRRGEPMTEEEYRAFEAEEEEDGSCPVCREKGTEITVGWSDWA